MINLFDFFAEIIQFLGQIVSWAVIIVEFVVHGLGRVAAVSSDLGTFLSTVPPLFSAIILFMLAILVFEFIRGR